jgi:adenylylsulfate kinase
MGAGKTTVLGEASDLLTQSGIVHAALDLDVLGVGLLPDGTAEALVMRNLESVCGNYANAGVTRLLLSEAVDSIAKRDRLRDVTSARSLTICRLRAAATTMQDRVRLREPGMLQEQFVRRVIELETALDTARVEDFSVDNDRRSVTDVAREVLQRARWL